MSKHAIHLNSRKMYVNEMKSMEKKELEPE